MTTAIVLDRAALVLNRRWMPIRTTTVREAICLVAKGAARVIEPDTFETFDLRTWADVSRAKALAADGVVRSVSLSIEAPEVVVLTTYEGIGRATVVFSRRNLFKRDRFTCQYCGSQPGPAELTVDHVLPKSRGGASSWENCVLACVECNARKANRTPTEARMTLRKQPRKPSWKALAAVPARVRRESWEKFLSRAYWEIELEP